jgi:hypothetical protein
MTQDAMFPNSSIGKQQATAINAQQATVILHFAHFSLLATRHKQGGHTYLLSIT